MDLKNSQIPQYGVIFAKNYPAERYSAIIFGDVIIAPAIVLREMAHDPKHQFGNLIKDIIQNHGMIPTSYYKKLQELADTGFTLITSAGKPSTSYKFNLSAVELLYICRMNSITETMNDILQGFDINSKKTGIPLTNNNYLNKLLLSSIVILQRNRIDRRLTGKEIFHLLTKYLDLNSKSDSFKTSSYERSSLIAMNSVHKLDKSITLSTPFGNESFFGVMNVGHVANVFGKNNSMYVLTNPLPPGCEGAPVFNLKGQLIGMVINTSFMWYNEKAIMTLAFSSMELLRELIQKFNLNYSLQIIENENQSPIGENCAVLIEDSSNWGTGCLVKIGYRRIIITCAHVIGENGSKINCTWKHGKFTSTVIWKNRNFGVPYDIAILSVPDDIPGEYFVYCDHSQIKIGERIFSIGFPHFNTLAKKCFTPSIYTGHITKYTKGIIFTDVSIQSGQSGGPLVSESGYLIGISVANVKHNSDTSIYPNINMAIPIADIYPILRKYSHSNNKNDLDQLIATHDIKRKWNLQGGSICSKL